MDILRGLQKAGVDIIRRSVPHNIRAAIPPAIGSPVASAKPLMSPTTATLAGGLGITANILSRAAVIPALLDQTQKVFNPKDNIFTSLQNLGTSIENQFAAPGQERRYIGSSPTAVRGNRYLDARADQARPLGQRATLNNQTVFWTGDKYRWQTGPSALKAGLLSEEVVGIDNSANASQLTSQGSPSAPILPAPQASPGGPAERALQREKIQAAAQVATNPLMQQWEAAKRAKDYEKADDLGMQIWQSKYGKTPIGQPGGALGTSNPLMRSTFGYQANMSPSDIAKVITNPSPVSPQPSEASIQMGDLGTGAMGDAGYDPARYGITPERIEAIKEKLLAQAKK